MTKSFNPFNPPDPFGELKWLKGWKGLNGLNHLILLILQNVNCMYIGGLANRICKESTCSWNLRMICRQWNEVKGNKKKPKEINRFQVRTTGKKTHLMERNTRKKNNGKWRET